MRGLFFILILTFAVNMPAQSPLALRLFDDGVEQARRGEFEKAASVFKKSLSAASSAGTTDEFLARVHFNLGVCEHRLGRNDRAVTELERAITLRRGDYAQASYALGMADLELGAWRDARLAFLKTLEARPHDGEAWFDLGVAYLGEGRMTLAETAFRSAVANGSRDTDMGHNNIGVLLGLRGQLSEATVEFETAIAISKGRLTEARSNLEYCRRLAANEAGLVARFELSRRGTARRG